MISRKSTKLIADAYAAQFKSIYPGGTGSTFGTIYKLKDEDAYNFLYLQEYDLWFLQIMNRFIAGQTTQKLVMAIMGIHTGETLVPATADLTNTQRQTIGQPLLKKLAEDMMRHYEITIEEEVDYNIDTEEDKEFWENIRQMRRPAEVILKELNASLEMDGYVYQEGHLYPTESAIIDAVEERTALERLVDTVAINNKAVINHHIQESEKAYGENRWGHSISDVRNVLEAILREVAAAHYLKVKATTIPDGIYKWAAKVRDYLLSESLIDKPEHEALWKIYGLISNTGSHPNIAEKDQARLMRYLSLTFSQYVLLQWEGYLKNNP